MRGKRAFTVADVLVVVALLAVNWVPLTWRAPGPPAAAEFFAEGRTWWEALGTTRRVRVAGPLGDTEVLLEPDGARVVSSPCPLQLCVQAGRIGLPGQVVACLPNRVAVRLAGPGESGGVDAVGR